MPDPTFLSGDAVPDYLRGVELMTAGMEWPASTGPVTITLEHIADAVKAANEDPHIQVPRIKLGHTSPLNGDHPDHDPFAAIGDAEPSFGQFVNLRAENDGAVLVGDADNILAWLAETAPSTYPNRSSEATWNIEGAAFDVQTAGGKRYSMVVTAVSLLGVYIPAIGDLEDLTTLIMDGPSALAASASASPPAATAAPAAIAPDAALSVSTDVIRQRFNFDWAMAEDNGADQNTYWWWARDIRLDPDEIIADDDEGNLWAVPFTTDGEDEITFGEPAKVRQTFVPVAAATVAACFSRPAKPSPQPAAAAAPSNAASARPEHEGVQPMDADVREFLAGRGIDPDSATDVQVNAATVLLAEQPPAEGDAPVTPAASGEAVVANDETGEAPAVVEPAPGAEPVKVDGERVPVAASATDPIAAAQKQAFDSLAAEVASLRAERDAANLAATTKRRDEKVSTALSAGRITPAEREHYRGLMDVDEERAGQLLEALPAGRVPLEARAAAPDPEGLGDDGLTAADRTLLTASRERMGFKAEVA